jgi:hypothetical protein
MGSTLWTKYHAYGTTVGGTAINHFFQLNKGEFADETLQAIASALILAGMDNQYVFIPPQNRMSGVSLGLATHLAALRFPYGGAVTGGIHVNAAGSVVPVEDLEVKKTWATETGIPLLYPGDSDMDFLTGNYNVPLVMPVQSLTALYIGAIVTAGFLATDRKALNAMEEDDVRRKVAKSQSVRYAKSVAGLAGALHPSTQVAKKEKKTDWPNFVLLPTDYTIANVLEYMKVDKKKEAMIYGKIADPETRGNAIGQLNAQAAIMKREASGKSGAKQTINVKLNKKITSIKTLGKLVKDPNAEQLLQDLAVWKKNFDKFQKLSGEEKTSSQDVVDELKRRASNIYTQTLPWFKPTSEGGMMTGPMQKALSVSSGSAKAATIGGMRAIVGGALKRRGARQPGSQAIAAQSPRRILEPEPEPEEESAEEESDAEEYSAEGDDAETEAMLEAAAAPIIPSISSSSKAPPRRPTPGFFDD